MQKEINNSLEVANKSRNYWLDNAKFLLILLVVVGHFISGFGNYRSIKYIYTFIYLFHMPLFIFITGFFSKKTEKSKNKIIGFIILYLIMQIIELIITKSNFTIVKPSWALWYLQSVIIYNLILPLINKDKPVYSLIISLVLGLVIGFDNNATTVASLSRTFVMLPFFIMGYLCNDELISKLKNKRNIIASIVILMVVSVLLIYIMETVPNLKNLLWAKASYEQMGFGSIGILYRTAWYLLSTITFLSVLSIIPRKRLPLISKFGSRTLQVYCIHIIVCQIFKMTELYNNIDTRLELILLMLGAVILTFVLSLKIFSYPFDFIMKNKFKSLRTKK